MEGKESPSAAGGGSAQDGSKAGESEEAQSQSQSPADDQTHSQSQANASASSAASTAIASAVATSSKERFSSTVSSRMTNPELDATIAKMTRLQQMWQMSNEEENEEDTGKDKNETEKLAQGKGGKVEAFSNEGVDEEDKSNTVKDIQKAEGDEERSLSSFSSQITPESPKDDDSIIQVVTTPLVTTTASDRPTTPKTSNRRSRSKSPSILAKVDMIQNQLSSSASSKSPSSFKLPLSSKDDATSTKSTSEDEKAAATANRSSAIIEKVSAIQSQLSQPYSGGPRTSSIRVLSQEELKRGVEHREKLKAALKGVEYVPPPLPAKDEVVESPLDAGTDEEAGSERPSSEAGGAGGGRPEDMEVEVEVEEPDGESADDENETKEKIKNKKKLMGAFQNMFRKTASGAKKTSPSSEQALSAKIPNTSDAGSVSTKESGYSAVGSVYVEGSSAEEDGNGNNEDEMSLFANVRECAGAEARADSQRNNDDALQSIPKGMTVSRAPSTEDGKDASSTRGNLKDPPEGIPSLQDDDYDSSGSSKAISIVLSDGSSSSGTASINAKQSQSPSLSPMTSPTSPSNQKYRLKEEMSVSSGSHSGSGSSQQDNWKHPARSTATTSKRSARNSISIRFRGASLMARGGSRGALSIPGDEGSEYETIISDDGRQDGGQTGMMELADVEQGEDAMGNATGEPKSRLLERIRSDTVASYGNDESTISSCNLSTASGSSHFLPDKIGSILKDTYSFLYVYPTCPPSAPFVFAVGLFLFQAFVYCILLASMIDLDDPYNPIHIPPVASTKLRIAQGVAIPIAVIINFDIMVAMNNLLNPPDEIISMDEYSRSESSRKSETSVFAAATDSTTIKDGTTDDISKVTSSQAHKEQQQHQQHHPIGISFQVANILRLLEGCLSIATSFLLIVQSANVIDLFIRFAAVEFVVHMDNLAFALAEHGLVGNRLQKAALHLNSLGYRYPAANPRTKKKRRGGSCTSAKNLERASRFSYFKKMFMYRLFRSPAKLIKNSPEATRKATLVVLLVTLITSWVIIIAQQSDKDYLCKNINVEFFHAHVPPSLDSNDALKPFLSSRSGTYVAMFDHNRSIMDWISNLRSDEYKSVLGYRKANEKVEEPFLPSTNGMEPKLVAPEEYVDVVIYDPVIKRWIFATCDPNADLIRDRGISCVSPELHSAETDEADLVLLSSSAFHLYSNPPAANAMFLPASISCNECIPRSNKEDYEALGTVDPMTCVDSGGVCSDPQEELGWSRNCVCPDGQYGLHCNEFYQVSEALWMQMLQHDSCSLR